MAAEWLVVPLHPDFEAAHGRTFEPGMVICTP